MSGILKEEIENLHDALTLADQVNGKVIRLCCSLYTMARNAGVDPELPGRRPMRLLIEAIYHRVPEQHVYTGSIVMSVEGDLTNRLGFKFEEVEMAEIATDLHHAVRVATSRADEFAVRIIQKATRVKRTVPMDLTPEQVNRIYQSPGEARRFFKAE